jgi:hypothetical protein
MIPHPVTCHVHAANNGKPAPTREDRLQIPLKHPCVVTCNEVKINLRKRPEAWGFQPQASGLTPGGAHCKRTFLKNIHPRCRAGRNGSSHIRGF